MEENENTLVITLTGDQSDLEFVRERCMGAIDDILNEYEQNLDGEVSTEWAWKR